MSVRCR